MNIISSDGLFRGFSGTLDKFRLPDLPSFHSDRKHLTEVETFGSNLGELKMFTFLPPEPQANRALVVVLHGCTQTAQTYDHGAGWSALAQRYGFALLLPEQQPANNPMRCFNWFEPSDTVRDEGEALSIRQMVQHMVFHHGVDARRIYVTGLSAGGAMASVMLATYPDVFTGGGIIAGLPYGAASSMHEAFKSMSQTSSRSERGWGDLVRNASQHRGPWPKISVWHGGLDTTVRSTNARDIVGQWANIHGLHTSDLRREHVGGYPRDVWYNSEGNAVIESYSITGMAHGTPLSVGLADDQCGAVGPFLLETGISSTFYLAKFWGLTNEIYPPQTTITDSHAGELKNLGSFRANFRGNDIGATIAQALTAAGITKE